MGILDALLSIFIALTDPAAVNIATLLRERAAQYGLAEVEARALVDLAVAAAWVSGERSLELTEQALRLCETQGDTTDARPDPYAMHGATNHVRALGHGGRGRMPR